MVYRRLLNEHPDRVESLRNFFNPVVLLQGGKSRSNCFIKGFRGDINRVLHVANIPNRDFAGSQHHDQEDSTFSLFVRYMQHRTAIHRSGLQRVRLDSSPSSFKMVEELLRIVITLQQRLGEGRVRFDRHGDQPSLWQSDTVQSVKYHQSRAWQHRRSVGSSNITTF